MKPKLYVAVLLVAAYIAAGFPLIGCAFRRPVLRPSAPAPSVSTSALSRSLSTASMTTGRAADQTQTAIRTVERLIPSVPPGIAKELQTVKVELSTVSADLRSAKDALVQAEKDRADAQREADALQSWGERQQASSIANAAGWAKAELVSGERQRHVLKLQTIVGLSLGLAAAMAGLRFFGPYGLAAGPVAWALAYFVI